MTLGERKLKVLFAVVEAYIATGDPVGSKAICEMMGNTVSSATIRNDMAALSEMGLLEQPHTSAGRIPTHQGYRVYIQNMHRRTLPESERLMIDSMLSEANRDPEQLLEEAAQVLASITNCAAVSTTPMGKTTTVRSVQVIPVASRTALIVLMTSSGIFKNKICWCDFTLTPEVMRVVARLMNEKVVGKPLSEITMAYLQTLAASIGEFAFLVSPILMALFEAVKDASSADVCLEGQANLLAHAEYDDTSARRILGFLNRRAELANLLNQKRGGVQTFIGREIDRPELADSSMVVARYRVGGEELGSIAVIGPTRMDYSKVMASLEYFSGEVGRILTELLKND